MIRNEVIFSYTTRESENEVAWRQGPQVTKT